uniref:DUF1302 domain-containing protein n=1 Tax=Candidatus Kentrum sp. DK TaxID=2126562 RepID=A0A450S9K6_9GAMM|nr:MAG: Protein of unknown function (DUF1302) [Candidatus Kentron sp. DK]
MSNKKQQYPGRLTVLGSAISLALAASVPASALEFDTELFDGSIDTTLSFGTISRVQGRDSSITGTAGGRLTAAGAAADLNAFDGGNRNYDTGMVNQVWKVISDIEVNHKSDRAGAFFRVKAFQDPLNDDKSNKVQDFSDEGVRRVGKDIEVLDAYGWFRFDAGGMPSEVRVGKQVLNWGESTFIQGGINAINPADMAALHAPGMELREALLPVNLVSVSASPTEDFSVQGFYQLEGEQLRFDPAGSYFSTLDSELPTGKYPNKGGQWGVALRYFSEELNGTEFGAYFMNYHSRIPAFSADASRFASATNLGFFLEYPEDVQLFGVSFNTGLGDWAIQGEYSFKKDAPLQRDDMEVLADSYAPTLPPSSGSAIYAPGYVESDVSQVQMTVSRIFNQVMGAESFLFLAEVGLTHVHDMPDQLLDGPGTITSGNQKANLINNLVINTVMFGGAFVNPYATLEPSDHFADATSWGYQLYGEWTFNDVFHGVNLLPHAAFQHDVNGISPAGQTGLFLEDRKSVSLGVAATYKKEWSADLSYTSFFGAGQYNLLNDRDYVGFNVKYSF